MLESNVLDLYHVLIKFHDGDKEQVQQFAAEIVCHIWIFVQIILGTEREQLPIIWTRSLQISTLKHSSIPAPPKAFTLKSIYKKNIFANEIRKPIQNMENVKLLVVK